MNNPWENIKLSDYENHMSLDTVYQLQALSEMMHKQLYTYDVKSIMILGIAGGNGLEHIDRTRINKVYGVDVNKDFLKEFSIRHFIIWKRNYFILLRKIIYFVID